jgi:hypothetical protein
MNQGALQLKRVINKLQSKAAALSLTISYPEIDIVRIEKRTGTSGVRTEFVFVVRVERLEGKEVWWPVEYTGVHGEVIRSEKEFRGRTLVNLQRQGELVNLAESWARSLDAQNVTQTVGNALL